MKYIICPHCELNYILENETICKVCKSKSSVNYDDDFICPLCNKNKITHDEVICKSCNSKRFGKL